MKEFKVVWNYLKNDKLKIFIYLILVFLSYSPMIFNAYLWGGALESLMNKNPNGFINYIVVWEITHIFFSSIIQIPREFLYNYLEIKFIKGMSNDLYSKMNNLPAIAFEEVGVGEFVNRLYSDTDRVIELLCKLIRMICKLLVLLVMIIVILMESKILCIEILFFALVMWFICYKMRPKLKRSNEAIKKESDLYVKSITENITGVREIKSLGIKKNIESRVDNVLERMFKNINTSKKIEVKFRGVNTLIYYLMHSLIIGTSAYFFFNNNLTYPIFIMISGYLNRIDDIVSSFSDFGIDYSKVKVSLKRINEILNNKLYDDEKFGNVDLKNIKGIVEFKGVKFKYSDSSNYTLKGLNLKIEPNKKIAIVGKSGHGKSTIYNLLLRYFDVLEGELLIDGVNIKDLTEESLRKNISVIRQEPFLFNLSILDNFKIVKDTTLEEVRKLCKKAYIDDYIMSLPNKYDTIVGEGGINLSGGQKQRLAIARTLLLNTKIILFDEATSALDNESQEYIKKTIDSLVKTHTIIIIAHRLTTIMDADVINVIENGKLIDSGIHSELLKNSKTYKKLYNNEV